jgi:hypothetical protein
MVVASSPGLVKCPLLDLLGRFADPGFDPDGPREAPRGGHARPRPRDSSFIVICPDQPSSEPDALAQRYLAPSTATGFSVV